MGITDALTLLLAVVAIIVSVTVAIVDYHLQKRNNAISLEADICMKIYFNYLVNEIPMARKYVLYNNCVLSQTDKLVDALNKMRRDSLFYKYRDSEYYNELCKKLQALEDFLLDSEGNMEHEQFVVFTTKMERQLEDIYQLIMQEYSGMRKR